MRRNLWSVIIMIRTIRWFIYFWLYQLKLRPALKKADACLESGDLEGHNAILKKHAPKWASDLLLATDCSIRVIGEENIRAGLEMSKTDSVLFVSNHQGNFDIPILISLLPVPTGFVAKDTLERMPMLNRWMKHIGCIFLDRDNARKAAASINQGVRQLKDGHSMVIFPEGTRSRDGQIGEFKAGALKLGTKAAVPIVPIAINGSINMMKKNSWLIQPAKVTVTFLPPIDIETVTTTDTIPLTEDIRSLIEQVVLKAD